MATQNISVRAQLNEVGNLLSSTTRVEAPFVRVTIAGYTFGVYEGRSQKINEDTGYVTELSAKYPNYIKSLDVTKINGTVNNYNLTIVYPITQDDDPNFFDKIFGIANYGSEIEITYGDFMQPEYIYRDEKAIITKITNTFDIKGAVITYRVSAWSATRFTLNTSHNFPSRVAKPSDIIKSLIKNNSFYHLQDAFTAFREPALIDKYIANDDTKVTIPACNNISVFDYLTFLVSYMRPLGSSGVIKNNIYTLTTYDSNVLEEDETGGAYFKVQKIAAASSSLNHLCGYTLDIGYQTANVVTSFNIENDENWSMIAKYNESVSNSDYLKRINDKGEIDYVYSPSLTGRKFSINENDSTWWTKMTQYPIKANITIKGLLKPVVLMSYIKVNVWFFGNKHISSGYYIITSEKDTISESGYQTTLTLLRVSPDDEIESMYRGENAYAEYSRSK